MAGMLTQVMSMFGNMQMPNMANMASMMMPGTQAQQQQQGGSPMAQNMLSRIQNMPLPPAMKQSMAAMVQNPAFAQNMQSMLNSMPLPPAMKANMQVDMHFF